MGAFWGRKRDRALAAKLPAVSPAEEARIDELIRFEQFCQQQRTRIRATLQQQTARIHRARFGDCEGDGSHFVVSRKGITEVSTPVGRRYQDQWQEGR